MRRENAGSTDMTSSKRPCRSQRLTIFTTPPSSRMRARISPGFPSISVDRSRSPARMASRTSFTHGGHSCSEFPAPAGASRAAAGALAPLGHRTGRPRRVRGRPLEGAVVALHERPRGTGAARQEPLGKPSRVHGGGRLRDRRWHVVHGVPISSLDHVIKLRGQRVDARAMCAAARAPGGRDLVSTANGVDRRRPGRGRLGGEDAVAG